jgi:tetratricopeptide (TPR) repeat protein
MDSPTATLITILRERIEALRQAGDLQEALHAANAAVEKAQQSLGQDFESIDAFAAVLEIRAEILREMANHEAARDDYRQAIDQLDDRPDCLAQLGRLHAGLGASHDALSNRDRATEHWQQAIACFERCQPPYLFDIAALSNNLGFLAKAAKDVDAAETHFLRALEILHSQLGAIHEETAAVSNNLGALYHSAKYYEQAREMHMMALEARRNLFGEQHPDTAQSHNNLALALLETGDRTWARRHFEKALAGFEALGPDYRSDLEAVASNYCGFLREEGEVSQAELIASRVKQVIDPKTA